MNNVYMMDINAIIALNRRRSKNFELFLNGFCCYRAFLLDLMQASMVGDHVNIKWVVLIGRKHNGMDGWYLILRIFHKNRPTREYRCPLIVIIIIAATFFAVRPRISIIISQECCVSC